MSIIKEFREFAMRGNVIDLAVGVVIGAAFGKIVDSLVKDIIMPPLGFLIGKVDFTNIFLTLAEGKVAGPYASLDAAQKAGVVRGSADHATTTGGISLVIKNSILVKGEMPGQGKLEKAEVAHGSRWLPVYTVTIGLCQSYIFAVARHTKSSIFHG